MGNARNALLFHSGLPVWACVISTLCLAGQDPATPLTPGQLAELPIEELMKVQATELASGTEKPVFEAPGVATVITARDIEAMGATTLEEALEAVPGLHVSRSSHAYTPKYLIRGISTTFNPETLVMVNGIPITGLLRGDRTTVIGSVPVSMIERIEVIRGPGSALYGADAFAGVINIMTRTAAGIQGTQAGLRAGSFETRGGSLGFGKRFGELDLTLMADYLVSDGHRRQITSDAQSSLDAAFGTNASLAPGPVNLSRKDANLMFALQSGRWIFRGAYTGTTHGTGQGVGEALDPVGRISGGRSTLDLTFHEPQLGEGWDFSSQLSYRHEDQEFDENLTIFPPGANLGSGVFANGMIGNPEYWERHLRFNNAAVYSGQENHRLRLGAGYFYGHIYRVQESKNFSNSFAPLPGLTDVTDTADAFLPEKSRAAFFLYGQDEWRLHPDWELTAGIRYDRYSDFGGTANPRAALVWKAAPELSGKLLYGRAFRAPSFAELYTANNPVNIGNPGLTPQTIDVIELAWAYVAGESWSAGLNLFHYEIRDLISFVRDPSGVSATAQNSSRLDGDGAELEAKFKLLPNWVAAGNYAFQYGKDDTTGMPLANAPRHKARLLTDWEFLPSWELCGVLTWIGSREREESDTRAPLGGYTTLDLILRKQQLFERASLTASVRNLFDADVREPSNGPGPTSPAAAIPGDLPQEGRNFQVKVEYRF